MKKLLLIFFCLTTLSAACSQQKNLPQSPYDQQFTIANRKIAVQVVQTQADKQLGLSFRDSMPEQAGMLFDFRQDSTKQPGFWMKDMHFPLDLVWIKNNRVIGITASVPSPAANTPDSNLKLYYPPGDIDYVLEVNAGWTKKNHITVGDETK